MTYAQLGQALQELGFTYSLARPSFVTWSKPGVETVLAFAIVRPEKPVNPRDLQATGSVLVAAGVCTEEGWARIVAGGRA